MHAHSPPGKRQSLIELGRRLEIQTDIPTLRAICRELAARLLDGDPAEDMLERIWLAEIREMPVRHLLPPGRAIPLSTMQAKLLGFVEAAGPDGADQKDVIASLWPERDAQGVPGNLRQLVFQTNQKLRQCDPHRRRIYRPKKNRLTVKTLAKR